MDGFTDETFSPACRHFGVCGGCSLQHMAPDAYRDWKRELFDDCPTLNEWDSQAVTRLSERRDAANEEREKIKKMDPSNKWIFS